MKLSTYVTTSFLASFLLLTYSIYTYEQLYPTILFLVSSKISFVITVNLMIAMSLITAKSINYFFLGQLRDTEVEMLFENTKFAITEICLAFTIFRNNFITYNIICLFIILIFIKSFHWLVKSRLDYLDQIMPESVYIHIKIGVYITLLIITDVILTYSCIKYTLQHGHSSIILFSFEFGLLCITIFNTTIRYILLLCDQYRTHGVILKGFYVMIIDLICDGLRFIVYICFFSIIFMYYGLPFHLMREVFMVSYICRIY